MDEDSGSQRLGEMIAHYGDVPLRLGCQSCWQRRCSPYLLRHCRRPATLVLLVRKLDIDFELGILHFTLLSPSCPVFSSQSPSSFRRTFLASLTSETTSFHCADPFSPQAPRRRRSHRRKERKAIPAFSALNQHDVQHVISSSDNHLADMILALALARVQHSGPHHDESWARDLPAAVPLMYKRPCCLPPTMARVTSTVPCVLHVPIHFELRDAFSH